MAKATNGHGPANLDTLPGSSSESSPLDALPPIPTMREALLASITDGALWNIADALYRKNATHGDGGTADAVRLERHTGQPTGTAFHTRKAIDRIRQLKRFLKRKNITDSDRAIAQWLLDDLLDALGRSR